MPIIKDISGSQKNIRRTEREDKIERKKTEKSKKQNSKKTSSAQKDKVQISSSGKSMMESVSRISDYQEYMDKIDNLGKEELKEVHQRVKDNYYDDPEVINDIVDSLTSSLPEAPVDSVDADVAQDDPQISSERLDEIKQNIEEDKYSNEKVLDSIVERMLDPKFL